MLHVKSKNVHMSLFAPKLEVDMRFFFISANAVAVYADLYAHICMKPHRKICIVYVDICIYADKLHMLI